MTKFQCPTCNKEFKRKENFKNHMSKKYPCTKPPQNGQENIIKSYDCQQCNKKYTKNHNLQKHMKKAHNSEPIEKVTDYQCNTCQHYFSSNNYLKKHHAQCVVKQNIQITESYNSNTVHTNHSHNNSSHNDSHNNSHNVTNNNIVFNFGSESEVDFTNNELREMIRHWSVCHSKYIEKIHFNPEHPENCNILLKNMRSKYIIIKKNGRWIKVNKKDLVDGLINTSLDKLNAMFNERLKDTFNNPQYKRVVTKSLNRLNVVVDDEEEYGQKIIREEIDLSMYNNSYLVKKI